MGKITLPMARNTIRRALLEIVDPSPSKSEKLLIWEHFEASCAFCGRALVGGKKEAHIDHLIPSSAGGGNHVSNRVLACATCNEHEKREMEWQLFLRSKVTSEAEYLARKNSIDAWQARFAPNAAILAPEVREAVREHADNAVEAFSLQADRVRELRARLSGG